MTGIVLIGIVLAGIVLAGIVLAGIVLAGIVLTGIVLTGIATNSLLVLGNFPRSKNSTNVAAHLVWLIVLLVIQHVPSLLNSKYKTACELA